MVNLKLTNSDYAALLLVLGYVSAISHEKNLTVQNATRELTDWILIQGAPDNYTYWNDKETLRAKKELELADPQR